MHHKEITIAVFIVRDEKGRTPYAVAGDKETRNEFRRFMACHPDRYDYVKAQVCFVQSSVSSVILCCSMKEASPRTRLSNSHGCRNLFWRIGELTVHGTFYSNTSTGLKHDIFDHVVSSFVNNIFLKAVYIREEFNSPRTASDIDMATAILLC